MNQFTKEELEGILEGITWWFDGDHTLYSEKLINKIKSMIDDYYDHAHEWVIVHTNPNIHDWGDETYYKCFICGKRL